MHPPLPSATPTWHNDTYPAISPQRPELTAAGKTVVITGAGGGIGRQTAIAFAQAGAARVVLLGQTAQTLEDTASSLTSTVSVTHVVDVTQEKELQDAAASIGTWDILVLGAGFVPTPSSLAAASSDDWWKGFEVNTKGTFLCIKAFLPTSNSSHATVLAVTSSMAALPAKMLPALSAYITSKLATTKIIEFLSAEEPKVFAAAVHPGMVKTAVFDKTGADANTLPMDKPQLPAHFMVWLASSEAAFLNGRSVWANWDVSELKEQKDSIQSGNNMTIGVNGWPYPNM